MNEQQRTPEWYLARKGKITASEIEQVMHKGKKDIFSTGCISYLKGAVAESFMTDNAFLEEKENEPTPYACKHGIFWEDKAREVYCNRTGVIVSDAPFLPMKGLEMWAGGSPDGMAWDVEKRGIIEIKCPKNSAVHLEHMLYQSQEDLKADNPQYYCQIQANMMFVSDRLSEPIDFCDFISYDPRMAHPLDMKVLRVENDEEYQAELRERIKLAVEWMQNYKNSIVELL